MKRMHRRLLLAVVVAVPALLALGFGLGPNRRLEKNWPMIQPGMSKVEVESLLGAPVTIYPAQWLKSNSILESLLVTAIFDTSKEKWAYGDRSFLTMQPEFPYVGPDGRGWLTPDEADHVVYFSADGVVTRKAYPYR